MYYTAVPKSALATMAETLRAHGVEFPGPADEEPTFGTPDELITTSVDCAAVAGRKYDSLAAHASQLDNVFFIKLGRSVFEEMMTREAFIRVRDRTGHPVPEDDLFAGLR